MQQEYLQIGEIVRPQGIRGEVKLRAMTEDMSRYARLESVFLKKGGRLEEKKVLKGRSYDGFAFLQLEGVNDRDAAEALRGTEVYVDRKHAIKLGADENFVCELIGLKAVDENGEAIGTLRDVLKPNTVCDVYVFDTARGELMIPALKRVVRKVDVDAGVMTLDRAALNEVAVWEDEPAERDEYNFSPQTGRKRRDESFVPAGGQYETQNPGLFGAGDDADCGLRERPTAAKRQLLFTRPFEGERT